MTCVIGMLDKRSDKVYIGADSAGSNGHTFRIRKDPKVFWVGNFLIGSSGSFRIMQLVKHSLIIPRIGKTDIEAFMCTHFTNALASCLEDFDYVDDEDRNEMLIDMLFIIGYKNRLFRVESDLQVAEFSDGVAAIGSGEEYALGAIHALRDYNLTTEQMIQNALHSASYYTCGVEPPFQILHT